MPWLLVAGGCGKRTAPTRDPAGSYEKGGVPWQARTDTTTSRAFERTSKRRKGYASETRVKRGLRIVHGDKELVEKLGRNDLRPCGTGRRFSRTAA